MASIIKIKRSTGSTAPGSLASGELAYSWDEAGGFANGKLWLGTGSEAAGAAANINVIGGKYFTDLMDHSLGTLTASSALLVDANKKLDNLKVDNLDLDGNTLSSTNTNGDISITPNGTGKTILANVYIGDSSTSLQEFIQDATSTNIVAGEGIDVAYDDNTGATTVSAEYATDTNPGIASFNSTDFSVNGTGGVSLSAERIQDIIGDMVSSNTENGIAVTYDDASGKLNFDVADPVITIAGDVDGSATMTNLANTTITVTLDTVNSNVGSFGSTTAIPVITVNAKGLVTAVSTANVATNLTIKGDAATTDQVALLTDTFAILGGEGIDTVVGDNTITISGEDASTTNKGVASFADANFTVTAGAVATKNITLGSSTLTIGSTTTSLAGLQSLAVDNISVDGNTISSTDTNGNIILDPNGTGVINVSAARITNLAEPSADSDAATKYYVDAARSGLDVKQSVKAATTGPITLSNTQTVDGIALSVGDRVLVKDQVDGTQNGIYIVSATAWTRSPDADNNPGGEVTSGMFTFVEQGTVNNDCGFVLTTNDPITLGTTALAFTLFSSSGTLIAGNGLSKNGYTLEVNVAATGGLEISADNLQLKSTVAGDGLTLTSGVLAVVGTANRITANADSIDIASTYVGQTSITTLGTVTTGTWNATTVAVPYGGTGLTAVTSRAVLFGNNTSALGVTGTSSIDGSFLREDSTGNPYWSNVLDGGTY
jgi:hypothetical protein